ncbi:MAG: T9SS type A sorting domain-containing protein [Bacteroidota bacterium]|nr:T9SS type A sorting domain-containing protein [Bacteroidota bacterium]
MKKNKLLLLMSIAFLLVLKGYSQSMILLEGTYQGKNVYVQNPFASGGVGFCVYEVRVNDQVTTDEIGSSAFEVDLRNFQLKIGDPVTIKIFHKDDCKPKVLNPEVLKPKSTFVTLATGISIDCTSEMLKWTTTGEQGKLTFIVEQYRWNKWVKVGEVDGIGTPGTNNYTFKVVTHSGENQFRVKQIDYSGQARTSPVAKCTSTKAPIKFYPVKAKDKITFEGGETLWEIYDQYGNIVKKGFGGTIDVTGLAKGGYFLNYDNSVGEFFKQ